MDIEPLVRFAARGNVLEVPDLREIGKTLSVLSNLRRMIEASQVRRHYSRTRSTAEAEILPDHSASISTHAPHFSFLSRSSEALLGLNVGAEDGAAQGLCGGHQPAQ